MYVGHVGIALGAKSVRKTVPLWLLVIAAQSPDWLDAVRQGIPRRYGTPSQMWTHSVPVVLALAAAFAVGYWMARHDARGALLLAGVVVSHILVDYLTGYKPTWPGGPMVGLQLYAHPARDLAMEEVVIVVGWLAYLRTLPSSGRRWLPQALVMLVSLVVLQMLADTVIDYQISGGVENTAVVDGLSSTGGVG